MHLFASLPFAIVLTLKRSLFAETGLLCWKPKPARQEQTKLFCVGNRSLLGRRANEVILCWKLKPARQESKRSYSVLETEAC